MSHFTFVIRRAKGLASLPKGFNFAILLSKSTVPEPQNGSKTFCFSHTK